MKGNPTLEELKDVWRRYPVDPADVRAAMSRVNPSWHKVHWDGEDGAAFVRGTLQAILTVARYDDGNVWVHVSACGRTGHDRFYLPSWDEMKRIKSDLLGADAWAYSVLPPPREYVNQNPNVLHLFARLDWQTALPDFTRGLGVL